LRPPAPDQVENAIDALQVHRQAFDTIGNLARYRAALEATHLLKVSERRQRAKVQFLEIVGGWFEQYLELKVMLQSIGIFAITPVGRPATGLHISHAPGFGTDGAKKGRRVKRAGADLHVQRLHDHTTLFRPVILQGLDKPLEATQIGGR